MKEPLKFVGLIVLGLNVWMSCKQPVTNEERVEQPVLVTDSLIIANPVAKAFSPEFTIDHLEQFFRVFNFDEDLYGNKLLDTTPDAQISNLKGLFSEQFFEINEEKLAQKFIQFLTSLQPPFNLNFSDKRWFAKVQCQSEYQGHPATTFLSLRFQFNPDGTSEWVLVGAGGEGFDLSLTNRGSKVLRPNAHELNFLRLVKGMEDGENAIDLSYTDYHIDYLSVLFYLLKNNQLHIKQVENIQLFFLQIPDWTLVVQKDSKKNSWLISELSVMNDTLKNALLTNQLHITDPHFLYDLPLQNTVSAIQQPIDKQTVDEKKLIAVANAYCQGVEELTGSTRETNAGRVANLLELFVNKEVRVVDDLGVSPNPNPRLMTINRYLEQLLKSRLGNSVFIKYQPSHQVRMEVKEGITYGIVEVQKEIKTEQQTRILIRSIAIDPIRMKVSGIFDSLNQPEK